MAMPSDNDITVRCWQRKLNGGSLWTCCWTFRYIQRTFQNKPI